MGRLSERWFGRFSDDWWDLTTTRALLAGLVQTVLYSILFVLLFALVVLYGVVTLTAEDPPAVGIVVPIVILVGVLIGVGSPYLHHTRERLKRLSRSFSFLIVVMFGFLGLYVLLLLYEPAVALLFAVAYLVSRALTFVGIYLAARV